MRRDEPGWWYDERARLMPALLAPLSFVYGNVAGKRLLHKPGYRSRLPVICVGNFTVGGSGKTPFVAYICNLLVQQGRRPAILMRGYGGTELGPSWVTNRHDARAVGDEALMHARTAPTVVAQDRAAGARMIETDARQFDAIVMDDGFQNRSLAKSLSIVLVSADRGLGNGRTLPGGPLRAPLDLQARLADVIVIVDGAGPADPARHVRLRARLAGTIGGRPVLDARVVPSGSTAELEGRRVIAYCGIGGPERFFATVEASGAVLAARVAFRDHHPISTGEAAKLLAQAREQSAVLVTTEKDIARLTGLGGVLADLKAASLAIPIEVVLPPADEARLGALLSDPLKVS